MGGLEPWHWIVLALVVAALFFSNKLPDAARSVGRSLRIFKTEIKGMREDDKARAEAQDAEAPKPLPAPLPQAEVVRREITQQPAAEAERSRPRPSPSRNGQAQSG
jgi:sec-independent protein translocase protein TatA